MGEQLKIIEVRDMTKEELQAKGWKFPLIIVETDKGVYFDNHPEKLSTNGTLGYNWKNYEGKTLIGGFELKEYGNYTMIKKSGKVKEIDTMNSKLEEAIKKALQSEKIVEICQSRDYHFQKLLNVKNHFLNFEISNVEISDILIDYDKSEETFEDFVKSNTGKKRELLELLAEFISYMDEKASGKILWNQYEDKRVLANSSVRQTHWVKNILGYKKDSNVEMSPSITNAIYYADSPMNHVTIFSENHRKLIAERILGKEYNSDNFVEDLEVFFAPFDIRLSNRMNKTLIISMVLYNKHVKQIWNKDFKNNTSEMAPSKNISQVDFNNQPLNQILYGPPGTGKTFKTKELAVNIVLGEEERSREEINKLYDDLVKKNKIYFTTFHQSMSYEDFVEGIKPETTEENKVIYSVQDGIFKVVCSSAQGVSSIKKTNEQIDFTSKSFFKMSLGGKNRKDIHNWCIDNNYISLGWGGNNDFSSFSNEKNWKPFKEKFLKEFPDLNEDSSFNKQAMYCFQHWMRKGDVVVATLGNNIVDAIGIVDGEYEFDEQKEIPYNHFRKVKWLASNLNASPRTFIDKNISQQTIYKFGDEDVKLDSFSDKFSKSTEDNDSTSNHVLIIDEINRGNVSSIFGELITLIEDDKRKGNKEEINLVLPYSKEEFSVPPNVHIIGTMNTADRSVEALDSALRRRFSFTEVTPNPSILKNELVHKTNGLIQGEGGKEINLIKLLNVINDRIELLIDKDHKIGHSYFITVENTNDLIEVFKNKVIPLLEEYFFGDYGKIGLVLGGSFIAPQQTTDKVEFAKNFEYEDADILHEKLIYKFTNHNSWTSESFISIYS